MKSGFCLMIFYFCILNFSLSQVPPDRHGLLGGEGMGQAKYAEINGYPGPKHVLELAEKLQLTASQKSGIETIYRDMSARAKELGQRVVDIENELHNAFKDALVTEKSVQDDSEEIGRLRGKLRAVHLVAHLKTRRLLTQRQIEMYKKLRQTDPKGKR